MPSNLNSKSTRLSVVWPIWIHVREGMNLTWRIRWEEDGTVQVCHPSDSQPALTWDSEGLRNPHRPTISAAITFVKRAKEVYSEG